MTRGGRTPVASIIIVVYAGGWDWLPRALDAIRAMTPDQYEVILLDNGPPGRVPSIFRREIAGATVIRNRENVGFGPACNQGAERARGRILCFLNPDSFVSSGWLQPLVRLLDADPGIGAVVPQTLNLDGTLQEAGAFVDSRGHTCVFGDSDDPMLSEHRFRREVDFGSASCLCIRRELFGEIGGFDPIYGRAYFEDADLCFRLRDEGFSTIYEPSSQVVHVRTTAVTYEEALSTAEGNRTIFVDRWNGALASRPTCVQVAEDSRVSLEARDIHAHERLLVVESSETAYRLAQSRPRARVTLVTDEWLDGPKRESLLAGGVEVAEERHWRSWLEARASHYTIIVPSMCPAGRAITSLAIELNPGAGVLERGQEHPVPTERSSRLQHHPMKRH